MGICYSRDLPEKKKKKKNALVQQAKTEEEQPQQLDQQSKEALGIIEKQQIDLPLQEPNSLEDCIKFQVKFSNVVMQIPSLMDKYKLPDLIALICFNETEEYWIRVKAPQSASYPGLVTPRSRSSSSLMNQSDEIHENVEFTYLRKQEQEQITITCYEFHDHKKRKHPIGTMSMNVNDLICGPPRCNYMLHSPQKKHSVSAGTIIIANPSVAIGRILFNCHMEALTNWSMCFEEIKCTLHAKKEAKSPIKFFFKEDTDKIGEKFSLLYTYTRSDSIRVYRKPDKLWKYHHELIWNNNELPDLSDVCTYGEMMHSSIRFQLKLINSENADGNEILYGECWIPISKIFSNSHALQSSEQLFACFESKLWLRGKFIGEIDGKVGIVNPPQSCQAINGISTEKGVVCTTSLVDEGTESHNRLTWKIYSRRNKTAKAVKPKEIQKLESLFFKLQVVLTKPHSEEEVLKITEKSIELLQKTTKPEQRILSFSYTSYEALQESRELLIDISILLLEYLDVMRHNTRCQFFDIIYTILKRSELADPKQFHEVPSGSMSPNADNDECNVPKTDRISSFHKTAAVDIELHLRSKYMDFLNSLFIYTLKKLNVKESFEELRHFCIRILVIGFVRLPVRLGIREKIISSILPNVESIDTWSKKLSIELPQSGKDFLMPEWNESSISRTSGENSMFLQMNAISVIIEDHQEQQRISVGGSRSRNNSSMGGGGEERLKFDVIDWSSFHQYLDMSADNSENLIYKESELELTEIMSGNNTWLHRLQKHGFFFFLFADEYLHYLLDAFLPTFVGDIPWNSFPGYFCVLTAFLLEIRTFNIGEYPESAVSLSSSFLSNANLLNTFMKIAILQVNGNRLQEVTAGLDLLTTWIHAIGNWHEQKSLWNFPLDCLNSPIPDNFDIDFLIYSLDLLFRSEENQILLQALLFVYRNWHIFLDNHQTRLAILVWRTHFWRLFTHWSEMTRKFYHHIIVLHLIPTASNMMSTAGAKIDPNNDFVAKWKEMNDDYEEALHLLREISCGRVQLHLHNPCHPRTPPTLHQSLGVLVVQIDQHNQQQQLVDRLCEQVPSFQLIYIQSSLDEIDKLSEELTCDAANLPFPHLEWCNVFHSD